jgi:two-component system sensor histidine kinase AlgZ
LDWRVETNPDEVPIPQLTLQALPENALFHGIAPGIEGGGEQRASRLLRGRVHLVHQQSL